MVNLLPFIIDLQLTNIIGGVSKPNMNILLESIKSQPGKTLMKLKLSGINLSDENIVQSLCEIVRDNNGNLSEIDLSWGCLRPDHLFRITDALN